MICQWNESLEHQAELEAVSDYWQTGRWAATKRRSDVEMKTEVPAMDLEQDFYPEIAPTTYPVKRR
jgi:hypothetical protein